MTEPGAFWETVALDDLDDEQWEQLCDGCGRCCAVKLQDPESGKVHYTSAACRLLDLASSRCTDYANRARRVPDCVVLNPGRARDYHWLPDTCAYRLRAEGKPLLWWHHLVSGSPATVHEAGISVRDRLVSEEHIHPEEMVAMLADLQRSEPDD